MQVRLAIPCRYVNPRSVLLPLHMDEGLPVASGNMKLARASICKLVADCKGFRHARRQDSCGQVESFTRAGGESTAQDERQNKQGAANRSHRVAPFRSADGLVFMLFNDWQSTFLPNAVIWAGKGRAPWSFGVAGLRHRAPGGRPVVAYCGGHSHLRSGHRSTRLGESWSLPT
jgi:hypothetical protein